MIGKIKWYNNQKGFGFIESDDHDYDIFVNHKEIHYNRAINDGDMVEFDLEVGNRGSTAKNVRLQMVTAEEHAESSYTHKKSFESITNLIRYKARLEKEGRLGFFKIIPMGVKDYVFYFDLKEKVETRYLLYAKSYILDKISRIEIDIDMGLYDSKTVGILKEQHGQFVKELEELERLLGEEV